MTRTFTVYGRIRGKGRPKAFSRGKFTSVYTVKEDKLYESQIASAYINDCGNPAPFGEVPLKMMVEVLFDIPQAFSAKKRELALAGVLLPTKKPDADNILKSIMDALNGKAYPDDKFVIDVSIKQRYAETEKMVVSLTELVYPETIGSKIKQGQFL
jgi:Holliday junction resolvase RusA-like endonuclease